MPYKVITEEVREKQRVYRLRWKRNHPDTVKEGEKKQREKPERKARETARLIRRYLFNKEFERLRPLGDLYF